VRVTIGEQATPSQIAQVLFEATQCPRTIGSKPQNIATDFSRFVSNPVRFGKYVGVDQTNEVRKSVVIAVVRCSG
jgi:hypothetical protein